MYSTYSLRDVRTVAVGAKFDVPLSDLEILLGRTQFDILKIFGALNRAGAVSGDVLDFYISQQRKSSRGGQRTTSAGARYIAAARDTTEIGYSIACLAYGENILISCLDEDADLAFLEDDLAVVLQRFTPGRFDYSLMVNGLRISATDQCSREALPFIVKYIELDQRGIDYNSVVARLNK